MALATVDLDQGSGTARPRRLNAAYAMLAVLAVVNLMNFMDRVLFSVMLEAIKVDLVLSDTQMGIVSGVAFAVLYGVFGLVMGRLADTRNRVRLLSGALAFWSTASALCGAAAGFGQMFAARAMVGVGVSGCAPCGQSIIADYFPPERRALALSIFAGVGTLGTFIGLVAGGHLAEAFGWRTTFILFAIPGLIVAPLVFAFGREPKRGAFDKLVSKQVPWSRAIRHLLGLRTARNLLVGTPLVLVTVGVANWVPAFLQRAHGATAAEVGTYGGASLGVGLVIGTLAGGLIVNALRKRNRLWEFWWPALATALSVPLLAAFYLAGSASAAYTILFFAFLIAGTSLGPSLACIMVVADASLRGTMVALAVLASSLVAYGLAPALVGIISDALIGQGFGEADGESLRYALMTALVFPLFGAYFFHRAASSVAADAVD
jgi:MFS family permease